MTLNSTYANLGSVTLPVWQERQKYMPHLRPSVSQDGRGVLRTTWLRLLCFAKLRRT